ncbi:hypothetical protein ACQ4PT_000337 [Festuca glaucescens]
MAGRKQAKMTSAAVMALVVVALIAIVAVAPAAATSPSPRYKMCNVDLVGMKGACEKYCARGSREARPSYGCCNAVRGADFPCLCRLKRAIGSMGNIDARRAMQIPSKCAIPGAPRSC